MGLHGLFWGEIYCFTLVTSSPLHYPCPYCPQKDTKQMSIFLGTTVKKFRSSCFYSFAIIDGISSNAERRNGHSALMSISSIMSIGSTVIRREWRHGHVSISILFFIQVESS
jgi:hypothetical protein